MGLSNNSFAAVFTDFEVRVYNAGGQSIGSDTYVIPDKFGGPIEMFATENGQFEVLVEVEDFGKTQDEFFVIFYGAEGKAQSHHALTDGLDSSLPFLDRLGTDAFVSVGGDILSFMACTDEEVILRLSRFNDDGSGTSGDGSITGSGSGDYLLATAAAEKIDGEASSDLISYENADAAVQVNLATGVLKGSFAQGDTLTSIEGVIGSNFADFIVGDDGHNHLEGRDGNDGLRGGDGNDSVYGGFGDDEIFAGPTDNGDDYFVGGAGNDTIGASRGNDVLIGGAFGVTSPVGGVNTLFAGPGDDKLVGGSLEPDGDTILNGSTDAGTYWAGTGNDRVWGTNGNETIGGGDGDDTISAYGGNDRIFSSSGNDSVNAGSGNDNIFSGAGNDTVIGEAGDDSLWGGGGDDRFESGTGNDHFYFGGSHGDDVVADFSVSDDRLDLSDALAGFSSVTDVKNATSAQTVAGVSGVLIQTGADTTLFLEGLTVSDLDAMQITV